MPPKKSQRNNPGKVRRSPRRHPGSTTPTAPTTAPPSPPTTAPPKPPPASSAKSTKMDLAAMKAEAAKDGPTDEEKKQKALNELKESLIGLAKKVGVNADDLLKVLQDDGAKGLGKVIDKIEEDHGFSMEYAKATCALTTYTVHSMPSIELKCITTPIKSVVEEDSKVSAAESPTEPPTSRFSNIGLEARKTAKQYALDALLLAEQVQRDLAEIKEDVASHGKDIAAMKKEIQEMKASIKALEELHDKE